MVTLDGREVQIYPLVWSLSGMVTVWCGHCLVWSLSGVVTVWCGHCLVWSLSGVVTVWCGLKQVILLPQHLPLIRPQSFEGWKMKRGGPS